MAPKSVTGWLQVFEDDRSIFFDLENDLLVAMDEGGNIRRVNRAFETTLGYTEADVFCQSLILFISARDLEQTAPLVCFLRKGGGRVTCQIVKWKYRKHQHYAIFRVVRREEE